jgi:alkaline phosphatase
MKNYLLLASAVFFFSCSDKKVVDAQPRKPKNVILLIGDGMGLTQIYAGMVANGDALNIERFKYIGFHKSYSSDNIITDSAAGATAFSCGEKTYNGAIGVGTDSLARETILETAEKKGLATGLVATCTITHATPASFIAHAKSRKLDEDIAADFMKTDVDVFIGGGKDYFEKRSDSINLLDKLKANGYGIATGDAEILAFTGNKLAGFIAPVQPDSATGTRGDILHKATQKALDIVSKNPQGFFMMSEGSQIDWGGHANKQTYIIQEMLDFDKAIGKALDFAEKDGNTLVIVTADHETGGFGITGGSIAERKVEGAFLTTHHTGVMIPVFAYGPGAEEFQGIYQNTDIYHKMMNLLGLKK